MNCCRLRCSRLLLTAVLWIGVCHVAFAEPSAPIPAQRTAPTATERAMAAQAMESSEPVGPLLPDEGPRVEEGMQEQGILDLAWQEARAAYRKGAWPEAKRLFERITQEYPESVLIPATLAFLAEIALQQDPSLRDRATAIQIYKTLVRDHPNSSNARRAQWRVADLYRERGWLQEAQASYERAMGQSVRYPDDHNRAVLGLGYTLMAMRRWREAEHAFMNLRKRSDQDVLSQYAAVGLAHSMYRQDRISEAHTVYDLTYRRWPGIFRRDPQAIHRYAQTQVALHHDASAREVMLLLYNLYPRHEQAPAALLYVAESMAAMSESSMAQFFYALVPSLYPHSAHSATAIMRMAALRTERSAEPNERRLASSVRAMIHNVPTPDLTGQAYLGLLQRIVAQQSDNALGHEARFRLGKYYEQENDVGQALLMYKDAVQQSAQKDNRWTSQASERLFTLLTPWIDAALKSHDDLTVVSLFHRYGPSAERVYARSPLMLEIADAHRRLGFALEAARLYQYLTRTKDSKVLEATLFGLGQSYLDQHDHHAARKVLERYRFQFLDGRYESEVLRLLITAMRGEGDLESVEHLCRQWLQHRPKHRDRSYVYLQLAEALGQSEKFEESVTAYEASFKAGVKPSIESLLAYAATLSRLNQHQRAITAYHTALEQGPTVQQAEWIHLQAANHWYDLKQYDRATVSLAEVGETDDPLINRVTTAFKSSLRAARRPSEEEGL